MNPQTTSRPKASGGMAAAGTAGICWIEASPNMPIAMTIAPDATGEGAASRRARRAIQARTASIASWAMGRLGFTGGNPRRGRVRGRSRAAEP